MTHEELVRAMASDLGSRALARKAAFAFVRALCYGLVRDGKVRVAKLGRFTRHVLSGRESRDFATGETRKARPYNQVTLRLARVMREALMTALVRR